MNVGYLIPYCLLFLFRIEEFMAVLWIVLFVVPLLDVFFYVETPHRSCIDNYWPKLCVWMWFPCFLQVMMTAPTTYISALCASVLYTISMNTARELTQSKKAYEKIMAMFICDFTGESIYMYTNWTGSITIFLWMFLCSRLWWHVAVCIGGNLLNYYLIQMEKYSWETECSSYGIGNYMFYRLGKNNKQGIPASYMWLWAVAMIENINK